MAAAGGWASRPRGLSSAPSPKTLQRDHQMIHRQIGGFAGKNRDPGRGAQDSPRGRRRSVRSREYHRFPLNEAPLPGGQGAHPAAKSLSADGRLRPPTFTFTLTFTPRFSLRPGNDRGEHV